MRQPVGESMRKIRRILSPLGKRKTLTAQDHMWAIEELDRNHCYQTVDYVDQLSVDEFEDWLVNVVWP